MTAFEFGKVADVSTTVEHTDCILVCSNLFLLLASLADSILPSVLSAVLSVADDDGLSALLDVAFRECQTIERVECRPRVLTKCFSETLFVRSKFGYLGT